MSALLGDFSGYTNLPLWLLAIVITWSLLWKGIALWKSAKRNSLAWFVVILVVNTLGILEILYVFLFSEINFGKQKTPTKKVQKKSAKKTTKKRSKK